LTGHITISRFLAKVPEGFSRSAHGRTAAPTGIWDHIIVFAAIVVVLVCVYLCIRYFLLPKESDRNHIKNRILRDDAPSGTGNDDDR
jgi:hypothetical protein